MTEATQANALALAYVGDAVLELDVREYLVAGGMRRPNTLHEAAVRYVSAPAQAYVLGRLLDGEWLDEEEMSIVRRGWNAKSVSIPKHAPLRTYRRSTAFEALIGYHHLQGRRARIRQITRWMFHWIEEGCS